ncbi:MAG TPA: PQQ-binding-like beta-propeller repeat protein [Thermoleophilaceae bacterium]
MASRVRFSSLGFAVLVYLVTAGAAAAQLPPLPPIAPVPPQHEPPAERPQPLPPQASPGSPLEAVAFRIDIGHSGVSGDDSLIPPLVEVWESDLGGPVSYPLIAGGRVFVAVDGGVQSSRIVALDRSTGKQIWTRTSQRNFLLAYGGGRLFSVETDGYVHALDPASGQELWERGLTGRNLAYEDPPIVTGELLVVSSRPGHSDSDPGLLRALRTSDGASAWERPSIGSPAGDGTRVITGTPCGGAAAYRPADGRELWRSSEGCSSGQNSRVVVAGGRVYTDHPYENPVLNAESGAKLFDFGQSRPVAVAGDVALAQNNRDGGLLAAEAGTGRRLWQFGDGGTCFGVCQPPVVSGAFVYVAQDGLLSAVELRSGRSRWNAKLTASQGPDNRSRSEMAIGDGILAVPDGSRLRAYTSALRPPPNGSDENTFRDYVVYGGGSTSLFGAVGRDLRARGPQPVTLESDRFPNGRFTNADQTTSLADGTFGFKVKPTRNTRYRTRAGADAPASAGGTIFVYPRMKYRIRRGRGRRINDITATVRMTGPPEVALGGRRIHFYLVRVGRKQVVRISSGGLRRTGRGRAAATLRFRALSQVGRRDYFCYCVRGLSRVGLGPRDVVDKRCGRSRLPY